MTAAGLWQLVQQPELRTALLILAALAGITTGVALRRFVRSERPDNALSNVAMVIGFGWSSEAVWVLTGPGGADLITPVRVALFAVFEAILIVCMVRAKRNMRILGHPGRAGRNAWLVATGMSLVAVWTAHNTGEAFLRLLVPMLLTAMWWDGLVGEGARRREDATSWRWTPRRLLLWLGAIEPGERDVETVHREQLTQSMTRLEFRRRYGWSWFRGGAARRLARVSLTADDEIAAEVRRRVDRAMWFEVKHDEGMAVDQPEGVPAAVAASRKARWVLHRRTLRTLRLKHPVRVVSAAPEPEPDPRSKQEIEDAIRFIAEAPGVASQRQIAHLLRTSPATVNRVLRRTQNPAPPPAVNGREPELTGS